MERRDFMQKSMALPFFSLPMVQRQYVSEDQLIIERRQKGKPHQGKVLAAIQPHCDDIPIFAGGTVAKLIDEGYTGYLIRTSNDDHAGRGASQGEVILNNERDNSEVAKSLGLTKTYDLGYRNHRMDNISIVELRARLIFLIRLLKIDTIITYDPWGHHEENPDHYVTARAVESARWMSGGRLDYPEHFDAGLSPHVVREMYYFARGPQLVNRIVDISEYIDAKVLANRVNISQGPGGENGARLMNRLAGQGKKLDILGETEEQANINYIKNFMLDMDSLRLRGIPSDKEPGKKFDIEWAECFYYRGPTESRLDQYIEENAR